MRLFSAFFGGKAINGNVTFCVWPDLWRHRWHQGQIFQLHLKDLVQDSLLPFEFFWRGLRLVYAEKNGLRNCYLGFLKMSKVLKILIFSTFFFGKKSPKFQILKKPDYIYSL